MQKKNRTRYISYLLFIISIFLLIVSSLPHHHHHNDGAICLKEDLTANENDSRHAQSHCCGNVCTNRFQIQSTNVQASQVQPHYLFSIILFSEPLLRLLLQPQGKSISKPLYLESLHTTSIAYAIGCRAPPSLL